MKKTMLILAAAMMSLMPVTASAAFHGGVVVASPFYGGFYSPFWGGYWGPAYGYAYNPYVNTGEVKLDTKVKDAQVFINNAYAGTTHDNKTMHLRPGNYKIEVREGGTTMFADNVYVVANKTLHLSPAL